MSSQFHKNWLKKRKSQTGNGLKDFAQTKMFLYVYIKGSHLFLKGMLKSCATNFQISELGLSH